MKFNNGQIYALVNIYKRGDCEPVSTETYNWLKQVGVLRDDGSVDRNRAYAVLSGEVAEPV